MLPHQTQVAVTDAREYATWTEVSPLGDLLVRAANLEPERDALVFPEARYSYEQLYERSMMLARALHNLGVQRGDHVGILAHNSVELAESLFGIALAGAVAVPINARHRSAEIAYIVKNADLVGLLTLGSKPTAYLDFPSLLSQSLQGLSDQNSPSELQLSQYRRLKFIAAMDGKAAPGMLSRKELDQLSHGISRDDVERRRAGVRLQDPAILLYTSGTTSNPKGCVLSHEALTRGPVHRARHRFGTGSNDVTWGGGPLFHIGTLSPFIGSVGAVGTYITDIHFDPTRAVSLMRQEKVTVAFPWFPGIVQPLLEDPQFNAESLPELRSILVIGPRPLIDEVQKTFPRAEMVAACGMTETAGIYALSDRQETIEERAEAQGKAAPGIEIRIIDVATGEDLPDGEAGELLVRGYCVMTEYYRDEEKYSH